MSLVFTLSHSIRGCFCTFLCCSLTSISLFSMLSAKYACFICYSIPYVYPCSLCEFPYSPGCPPSPHPGCILILIIVIVCRWWGEGGRMITLRTMGGGGGVKNPKPPLPPTIKNLMKFTIGRCCAKLACFVCAG